VKFPRASGILLHPTSLPGRFGIGELGPAAFEFVDFLQNTGQKLWQVLPLNPTGFGDSPYQSFSAFAGSPLLISIEDLIARGVLDEQDLADVPRLPDERVDFGAVIPTKYKLLTAAADHFFASANSTERTEFEHFCTENSPWLNDYSLFMAAKNQHGGAMWTEWAPPLRKREPAALQGWCGRMQNEVAVYKYWQFEFFRQWERLKNYCNARGIRIMGDIPIYVALDSSDVWTHPEMFYLDAEGRPTKVAGVPPDYFSGTGQLWGNPIYRWDRMKEEGYSWWIERFGAALRRFDVLRVDHFRGFEAYWEVPAGETTAINGRWVQGPGAPLFEVLEKRLGKLPLVAENLGVITPAVEDIRTRFGFPGMALLQFAFGTDPQGPSFRPHNYVRELVAYTGGHDNDTTLGWWSSTGGDSTRSAEDIKKEHDFARAYLGLGDEAINWALIRAVEASVADIVIIPLQDVLGLGSEARMNLPGSMGGWWRWRYRPGALTEDLARRLRAMAEVYDR
jgi:4-alpha-glucanotransferase